MKDWYKAGEIAIEAREYGKKLIKTGVLLIDVSNKIETKIKELGGKPAFPAQLSINEMAAHYNPFVNDETKFKDGDLVKLDLGVHINGAIADTAVSIDLGDNFKLIKASKDALKAAVEIIRPGVELREVGKVIGDVINSNGFNPIRNLGGHGLELYKVHTSPFVPNFDNGNKDKLKKGDIIAVEPFATKGDGMIYEGKPCEVYELKDIKPVRDMNSRKLMKFIAEEYKTLPFAKRWLTNFKGYNFSLNILEKQGIIHHYPQLPEKSRGMVSQHEHTIIVGDKVTTL